jgi:hypothetical protein
VKLVYNTFYSVNLTKPSMIPRLDKPVWVMAKPVMGLIVKGEVVAAGFRYIPDGTRNQTGRVVILKGEASTRVKPAW